ncbi:MAG: type VI secretion system baseplate subunit TssG, partial [Syntrophobacteraceae bacterium]|nr:type VI secretion system baseplate subunit TssG [Syntrophobacteraceae bacterium]
MRDSLFREFYEFSFFRAVHLLEWLHPEKKRLGEAMACTQEPVRFSVKPGFAFPPSDISGMEPGEDGEPSSVVQEGGGGARVGGHVVGAEGPCQPGGG